VRAVQAVLLCCVRFRVEANQSRFGCLLDLYVFSSMVVNHIAAFDETGLSGLSQSSQIFLTQPCLLCSWGGQDEVTEGGHNRYQE
jgi:hypothetical protein